MEFGLTVMGQSHVSSQEVGFSNFAVFMCLNVRAKRSWFAF